MTQNEQLMRWLKMGRSITARQALDNFGIMRLAARIYEIRNEYGIPVASEMIEVTNRYGEVCRVARYWQQKAICPTCNQGMVQLPGNTWICATPGCKKDSSNDTQH